MNNTRLLPIAFVWLGLLVMASCSRPEKDEITPAADAGAIVGNWVLLEPASDYTVTLQVTKKESFLSEYYAVQLTGQSSVNQYFGTGSFSERPTMCSGPIGTGSASAFASTKIGGTPAAMQFEDTYFARLKAVNFAGLVGKNRLHLRYAGTSSGVLVYKRQ